MDRMYFDEKGFIQPVKITKRRYQWEYGNSVLAIYSGQNHLAIYSGQNHIDTPDIKIKYCN
jgi:hypothetical protein